MRTVPVAVLIDELELLQRRLVALPKRHQALGDSLMRLVAFSDVGNLAQTLRDGELVIDCTYRIAENCGRGKEHECVRLYSPFNPDLGPNGGPVLANGHGSLLVAVHRALTHALGLRRDAVVLKAQDG